MLFGDEAAMMQSRGVGSTCPPLYPPNGSEFFYGSVTECTSTLPLNLLMGRYRMLKFDPDLGADPYILYDPAGKILGVWDNRPSYWELMEVAHG
jgi:hypothetical protein